MQIANKVVLSGTPEQVWEVVMDPQVLQASLPGCEKLETTGPDSYVAHLSLGVAAIKGKYQGNVQITDKQPPTHYSLLIDGKGTPGWVKAKMDVDLSPEDGKTAVSYQVDAQIGGLVASVGSRMLSGVGKMLLADMFKSLDKQIQARFGS